MNGLRLWTRGGRRLELRGHVRRSPPCRLGLAEASPLRQHNGKTPHTSLAVKYAASPTPPPPAAVAATRRCRAETRPIDQPGADPLSAASRSRRRVRRAERPPDACDAQRRARAREPLVAERDGARDVAAHVAARTLGRAAATARGRSSADEPLPTAEAAAGLGLAGGAAAACRHARPGHPARPRKPRRAPELAEAADRQGRRSSSSLSPARGGGGRSNGSPPRTGPAAAVALLSPRAAGHRPACTPPAAARERCCRALGNPTPSCRRRCRGEDARPSQALTVTL